ncbi:MAG: LPXTG cell wall anchor domain-containing protein [Lentisphaerae bacterium]|nr:LPXTG cell wall anchor domain-containing protein [Lentisphaerota bacterium]
MKTKAIIVGLIMFLAFSFNVQGQGQEQTFLEESEDSAKTEDMLYYGLEDQEKGASTGLIIGIVAVVVVGGGVFFLMKKKKK